MVGHLRQAIAAGTLEIYVQLKASLATGKFTGTEALVRWKDHQQGTVHPAEFIPLAERSGLIRLLTDGSIAKRRYLAGRFTALAFLRSVTRRVRGHVSGCAPPGGRGARR